MAENCGFFDAHIQNDEYDRVYFAESFAKYFSNFIGNGIFSPSLDSTHLKVVENPEQGMSILVNIGKGWINGYWYENTSDLILQIESANNTLNRIDAIVLRWGKVERAMWIAVKSGEASAEPTAPQPQRDADYYELILALVSVQAGQYNITNADITDTRFDTELCGAVRGLIDQSMHTHLNKSIIDTYTETQGQLISSLTDSCTYNSPTFTGTTSTPTKQIGTNNTEVASTAFVQQELKNQFHDNLEYVPVAAHNYQDGFTPIKPLCSKSFDYSLGSSGTTEYAEQDANISVLFNYGGQVDIYHYEGYSESGSSHYYFFKVYKNGVEFESDYFRNAWYNSNIRISIEKGDVLTFKLVKLEHASGRSGSCEIEIYGLLAIKGIEVTDSE